MRAAHVAGQGYPSCQPRVVGVGQRDVGQWGGRACEKCSGTWPALPCPALLTQGISPDRDSPISLNCWVVSVLAAGKFLEFVWMLGCAWRTHIANTSHAMRREGVPGGGTAAGKFRQAGGS
jgi:hypothetical protein